MRKTPVTLNHRIVLSAIRAPLTTRSADERMSISTVRVEFRSAGYQREGYMALNKTVSYACAGNQGVVTDLPATRLFPKAICLWRVFDSL